MKDKKCADAGIHNVGKILGIIWNILVTVLFLGVEAIMIRTEGGIHSFLALGSKKLLLVMAGNVIFFFFLICGEKLQKKVQKFTWSRWIGVALAVVAPFIMFEATQVIMYLCGIKNISKTSFLRIAYMATDMQGTDILKNMAICFLLLFMFILIFRKVNIACGVFCYLLTILALVNYYVAEFRGQPFLLMDVMAVGTAADVVGEYRFEIPIYLGILLLLLMAFVRGQMSLQRLELGKRSLKNLTCRMGNLLLIVLVIFVCKPLWQNMETVSLWNTNKVYRERGYLCTLVREVQYMTVQKPDGYSEEKAREIIDKEIKQTAETFESGNADGKDVPANIIMIMNESLTDFESIGNIKTDAQILPFIRSLNKNVKHGQLHVSTFGGGTARSEFEALTGNTMFFMPSGSVPYQLYIQDPEYGMAEILKSQGYHTIAIHPNKAKNWNRMKVYPKMQFDEFISLENWGDDPLDKLRDYASDKTTFEKLIRLYERKDEGEKLFLFCVTMQNHGGYGANTRNGFEPSVKLDYTASYPKTETYLSLEQQSDMAFKELLEYFEKVKEPTMIVMFGDHWPKLENGFTRQLLGKNIQDLKLLENQKTYCTPYVIWTNYPSETVKEDISANYLGSYVLQQAGVELTDYNRFLLKLKETLPVIGMDAVCDKDGNWYSKDELPEEYRSLLNEYNILEYNNQIEKKHRIKNIFALDTP